MSTPARRRLLHDFKKIQEDSLPTGITAAPNEDNIMVWQAVIFGYFWLRQKKGRMIHRGRVEFLGSH